MIWTPNTTCVGSYESPIFMKDEGRRAFDFTCLARKPLLYGNLICTFEFVSENFLGSETDKHQGVFQPHGFLTAALNFQNETFTLSFTWLNPNLTQQSAFPQIDHGHIPLTWRAAPSCECCACTAVARRAPPFRPSWSAALGNLPALRTLCHWDDLHPPAENGGSCWNSFNSFQIQREDKKLLSGRKPAIVTPCNTTYFGEMMLRYGVQYIHVSPQKSRFPAVVVVASCLEVHWWPHRFALATRRTHQHETRLRKRNRKGLHHHAQFILISPLHSPSFCIPGLPSVFWSSILLPSSPIGTNKAMR